jgi:hypothetical protein
MTDTPLPQLTPVSNSCVELQTNTVDKPLFVTNVVSSNGNGDSNTSSRRNSSFAIDPDTEEIINWKDGIGTLPNSNLKVRENELGELELILNQESDVVEQEVEAQNVADAETELLCEEKIKIDDSPIAVPKETEEERAAQAKYEAERREMLMRPNLFAKCVNCGAEGRKSTYIRLGKYCSQTCATLHTTHLRNAAHKTPIKESDRSSPDNRGRRRGTDDQTNGDSHPASPDNSDISPNELDGRRKRRLSAGHTNGDVSRPTSPDSLKGGNNRDGMRSGGKRPKSSHNENHRPVSPSTNSESHTRPGTPNSVTPQTALHQSIFAMRAKQQMLCDAPLNWQKTTTSLLATTDQVKPIEVLRWDAERVSGFVNSIPGCSETGQTFLDELVDGEAFLLLTQQDIVKVLNIKLGPAVKIYNSILLLRDALEEP